MDGRNFYDRQSKRKLPVTYRIADLNGKEIRGTFY